MPVDLRFFRAKETFTVEQLAKLTGATCTGDTDRLISGIAAADQARSGDVCFFEGKTSALATMDLQAGACFVTADVAEALPDRTSGLIVEQPRLAHVMAANAMFDLRDWTDEGEPASVHPTAKIAPGAYIGAGAAIGERAVIGPNSVIGPGVQIGADTSIGANASIRCALIGNHVNILSGARIGESGFGVTSSPEGAVDVPQWGRVIIQDHVMIGGNTCIDRGAFTDTIVGERSKIDNLVQIGHNVVIGRNVLMASFTGISGSSTVGDGVLMGGRVGIADHLEIGEGAVLTADAGVMTNVPAGETWGGRPAKNFRQFLREVAWLQRQVKRGKKPSK
ncbi:MAG: UDP-3-O-(3-hydroxymyristoyl)glucosamine N-acyltransferase [Henriciella sp.]|nr:UDP-3-O-(3-hydroxymyristoyl)glucosamine N-acyltransferase [Henriciella sp.]